MLTKWIEDRVSTYLLKKDLDLTLEEYTDIVESIEIEIQTLVISSLPHYAERMQKAVLK